jgi:LmbE family N-acetylglucosaminyl deacetylase
MSYRAHRRTLLGVWAHPDDEAYLSAGLMATFRRRGDRVVLVTATLGEHGTNDAETWPPERLAALRRVELRNSLAALDVDEFHLLGYEDGTCAQYDATDVVRDMIGDIQPDVIVTFGPDGMTGHPDHRAVSAWTTEAWATTRPSARLWYATLTPDFHRLWGALNDRVGLWAEQPEPPQTAAAELAHQLRLGDDVLDQKMAALDAHASQTTPLVEMVGRSVYREWWRTEWFRAADLATTRAERRVAQTAAAR